MPPEKAKSPAVGQAFPVLILFYRVEWNYSATFRDLFLRWKGFGLSSLFAGRVFTGFQGLDLGFGGGVGQEALVDSRYFTGLKVRAPSGEGLCLPPA